MDVSLITIADQDQFSILPSPISIFIFNRKCLEICTTRKEVQRLINSQPPLFLYHLNVAEASEATTVSTNQHYSKQSGNHVIRGLEELHSKQEIFLLLMN